MSRVGIQPIEIPKGVDVKISGQNIKVKGPKGLLERDIHEKTTAKIVDNTVVISPVSESKALSKYHGLTRSLVNSMVIGTSVGFTKKLTIVGVGWRAQQKGKSISLNLGYSNPIEYTPLEGVDVKVEKPTELTVFGPSKEDVGQVAAVIRGFRKPEPYHGKGVRYSDELVRTKVGKAAAKT